jgi:diguanylate cyclase (GGDEF)-like protein
MLESHTLSYSPAARSWFQRLGTLVLTDDFRQRRRITVILMTACVYMVCTGILIYGARSGIFSFKPALWLAACCTATAAGFLAVVRSGLNLKFAQPSLALSQALCAQTLVAAAYAVSGPVHPSTLILLTTVMVFGMFEMDTPRVWKLLAYTIGLMGATMAWSSYNDPALYPAQFQLIYFAMMVTVLPSISSLSVQLRRMRERLRTQKAELRSALEHILTVATHDELTGLPNRRHMLALLSEHTVRQSRGGPDFSVALADMDYFKNVNDTFGHRIGDAALVCFAKQARVHLRATDMVGRWGGEEFLIILPESPPGDPNIGIERLRGALAVTEVSALAPHLRVAFSTGITRYRADEQIDDVIERADQALYVAKASGRNQTIAK